MNGRVYDPAIGRFLSADPYIDCAQDMAGWNRYSYVKNNLLAFTDPRGFSRLPPSPALQRVDPGLNGLENIVVEGSRLESIWESFRAGIAMNFYVTTTTGSTAAGGGGQSGGDGTKQREEQHKECLETCQEIANSVTQTLAGILGGATAGFIASATTGGAAVGAGVGGVTALALSLMPQGQVAQAYGGLAIGTVGGYFEARHQGGSTGPGAIGGAIGEAVGGAVGGPDGSVIGGSVGGAVGAGLAARANGVVGALALGSAFGAAAAGALGGQVYNLTLSSLDPITESTCETICRPQ
jgi:hypothetical protein